jgi:hypothetical protein
LGTTSEIEVVPPVHSRSRPKATARTTDLPPAPPATDSLTASFTVSARRQNEGRRSLPPTEQAPVRRSEQETWRERPRCARPMWPHACPEGSLTPWLSLSHQGVGGGRFGGEKRRVFGASTALDCDPDLPDHSVPFVRKMLVANRSRSRALAWAVLSWKSRLQARCISMSAAASRGDHTWNHVDASAITAAMLHLCSAPYKALRFALPARTRGLRALTVPARR